MPTLPFGEIRGELGAPRRARSVGIGEGIKALGGLAPRPGIVSKQGLAHLIDRGASVGGEVVE